MEDFTEFDQDSRKKCLEIPPVVRDVSHVSYFGVMLCTGMAENGEVLLNA